jgi:D-arabinose 1-dehydrogenase-like Zn-dependent alcohol dehydrogenase
MYSFGGLADYVVAPIHSFYRLTDNIPFDRSAILGCAILTAYGALRNGGVR